MELNQMYKQQMESLKNKIEVADLLQDWLTAERLTKELLELEAMAYRYYKPEDEEEELEPLTDEDVLEWQYGNDYHKFVK